MGKLKCEQERIHNFKIEEPVHPFESREKDITGVELVIENIDDKYKEDIETGNGFLITDEEDYDEKRGVRTMNGLYSPKFGIDTFTDKVGDEQYHCECGAIVGGIYEGEICPVCHTMVRFADASLSITGYISMGNFCVINPAIYVLLEKLFGGKELESVIKFNNKFNVKGKNVSTKTKNSPYNGIGLITFRENFDEILTYYRDKRKRNDVYDIIMKYRDATFTHYVNVYSALLRPLVKDESRIAMFKVNKMYSTILANANIIRATDNSNIDKRIIVEGSLFEIQQEFMNVYDEVIDNNLSSKNGILRGKLLSERVDFSAREVIVAATHHDVNEVSLPYITGCELLRPLIIHELVSIEGINVREANTIVDQALRKFDKRIWLIMNYIIQKSKNPPMVIVQRSPSLLQESMRLMNIKEIKADLHDFTMDTPEGILSFMNADFDGDTMSTIMIFDNRLKEAWIPMHSPINHFVSRHDGRYSSGGEFIKDSAVILSEMWELGKDSNYYEYWAKPSEINNKISEV